MTAVGRIAARKTWGPYPDSPLWMAPALQEAIRCFGALVGCSLLSGLLMQP